MLILAMVLTSLLAVIGVVFLLSSRVDSVSTSALSDNKDLNLAVDTVVARLGESIALDVPGVRGDEYYDYPDVNNEWLASLEPNDSGFWNHISDPDRTLEQCAWYGYVDIFGDLVGPNNLRPRIVAGDAPVTVAQHPVTLARVSYGGPADADGDGVADSRWVPISDFSSSKGKSMYAAIRVVDNGGMLNINTGLYFDPYVAATHDGSSQSQIDVAGLSRRDATTPNPLQRLVDFRSGAESNAISDIGLYEQHVTWKFDRDVNVAYTPFDISDELKLRNRYIINWNDMTSRIELLWTNAFDGVLTQPRTTKHNQHNITDPCDWFWYANYSAPNPYVYDYSHIATTHSIDRIIDPNGLRMFNLNTIYTYDPLLLRNCIESSMLQSGYVPAAATASAAQVTANLLDYFDPDVNDVNVVYDTLGNPYYGFERPAIFISELAAEYRWKDLNDTDEPDVNLYRSYAIELFKIGGPEKFNDWRLVVPGEDPTSPITLPVGHTLFDATGGQYVVFLFEEPNLPLKQLVQFSDTPHDGAIGVDPDVVLTWSPSQVPGAAGYDIYIALDCEQLGTCSQLCDDVQNADRTSPAYLGSQAGVTFDPAGPNPLALNTRYCWRIDVIDAGGNVLAGGLTKSFTTWQTDPNIPSQPLAPNTVVFHGGQTVELQRFVPETGQYITVDAVQVPDIPGFELNIVSPFSQNDVVVSLQRDARVHRCLRRVWPVSSGLVTLGHRNVFEEVGGSDVQAFAAIPPLTNVGQIGAVLRKSAYGGAISPVDSDRTAKIDLADAAFQRLLSYLTVIDPALHGHPAAETRVKGRMNINTAPWYVLAQLPWMSQRLEYGPPPVFNYRLAQTIAAYRDRAGGFRNVAELMSIDDPFATGDPNASMFFYAAVSGDLAAAPDLTPDDDAVDDLEERDVLFSRISNLVTVRSDVFTAYILVRIGQDGPQKRVIALLDRSEVVPVAGGRYSRKVKILALHPVPDSR